MVMNRQNGAELERQEGLGMTELPFVLGSLRQGTDCSFLLDPVSWWCRRRSLTSFRSAQELLNSGGAKTHIATEADTAGNFVGVGANPTWRNLEESGDLLGLEQVVETACPSVARADAGSWTVVNTLVVGGHGLESGSKVKRRRRRKAVRDRAGGQIYSSPLN